MLRCALAFFILAIVAGPLGFTGISMASPGTAQILFFAFLILLEIALVVHLISGRAPPAG